MGKEMCVCVCVRERERDRQRARETKAEDWKGKSKHKWTQPHQESRRNVDSPGVFHTHHGDWDCVMQFNRTTAAHGIDAQAGNTTVPFGEFHGGDGRFECADGCLGSLFVIVIATSMSSIRFLAAVQD